MDMFDVHVLLVRAWAVRLRLETIAFVMWLSYSGNISNVFLTRAHYLSCIDVMMGDGLFKWSKTSKKWSSSSTSTWLRSPLSPSLDNTSVFDSCPIDKRLSRWLVKKYCTKYSTTACKSESIRVSCHSCDVWPTWKSCRDKNEDLFGDKHNFAVPRKRVTCVTRG